MYLREFSFKELAELYRLLFEQPGCFLAVTIDDVLDEIWRRVTKCE